MRPAPSGAGATPRSTANRSASDRSSIHKDVKPHHFFCLPDERVFYRALSLAALARDAEPERRAGLLERLRADVELYARWSTACRHNFAHRHALLCAKLAFLDGHVERAMAHYDEAISWGMEHGFMHHVALASELAGRFHHAAGRAKIAHLS